MASGRWRPLPPGHVLDGTAEPVFVPAPEIIGWATALFIESGADLYNEDHKHLNFAKLGALWTNVPNGRAGRRIIGQAERGLPPAGKWMRGRIEMQLLQWFGWAPDFVLTFDAQFCSECDDATFCALVEHELAHCGQERDEFGALKFRKSGLPALAPRGHDVEAFISIAARYGAVEAGIRELAEASS